ncbi:branched-chain amino acid ABC transporter permease [Aquisalimonas lutea]|uniref:branched-chain amino acid ABC transporter permease n=1 Tax=Aquisalimonas lutea TaxID=1327750 RepID=UPI0025B4AF0D|nr:branched-chain amino acid ABC transporter permease [Aquisalimonas lutea]MDN3518104.1 branched-chain amino acid ABC transporter permease [Aquisalimonas lutea]
MSANTMETSTSTAAATAIVAGGERTSWKDVVFSPRYGGLAALLLVVLATPLFIDGVYQFDMAILVMINAAVVIALNLLVGYAGQVSLGHAAFFGLGGYATAILTTRYEWPSLLALGAGVVLVVAIAAVIARPILRLKGYYLAMATLGLGMIIYLIITQESWLTGGPDGTSVAPLEVYGYAVYDEIVWYWLLAALVVVMYWLALNIIDSPVGRALRALHGSEIAADNSGIDVNHYKTVVFVLSAGVAALMGGLYAFYSGFIAPSTAGFMHSIELVVMVVLGGMASLVGSVVGAVLMTLLPQYLVVLSEYEWLVYGLVLMLVMIFMPRGLVPTLHGLIRRVTG